MPIVTAATEAKIAELEAYVKGWRGLNGNDWFQGWEFQVEQFKIADNKILLDSQVALMVQTMAGFSPSGAPSSVSTLTTQQQQDFATLVASNWQ